MLKLIRISGLITILLFSVLALRVLFAVPYRWLIYAIGAAVLLYILSVIGYHEELKRGKK